MQGDFRHRSVHNRQDLVDEPFNPLAVGRVPVVPEEGDALGNGIQVAGLTHSEAEIPFSTTHTRSAQRRRMTASSSDTAMQPEARPATNLSAAAQVIA